MKICITTTPARSETPIFPPIGSTTLLDALTIKGEYDARFYDINTLRPNFKDVVKYFKKEKFDIVGISAVISTVYRYTKELTHAIKMVSPKTAIILGGCLAASAEVLLRKCPIDLCVIGEGEKTLVNLVKHWEKFRNFNSTRRQNAGLPSRLPRFDHQTPEEGPVGPLDSMAKNAAPAAALNFESGALIKGMDDSFCFSWQAANSSLRFFQRRFSSEKRGP